MGQLNFKILGRTQLRGADHFDDRWGQPKPRGMLATLLVNAPRIMSIDMLVEWIWPDGMAPRDPRTTLQAYANRIRKAFFRRGYQVKLSSRGGMYEIDVDREEIDYFKFRALMDQARSIAASGEHERASELIISALDLWVDQPLADLDSERARNWRYRAEFEHWVPANDALFQSLSALGRFDEVLRRHSDLPVDHQLNLAFIKRRIEALYGLHQNQEAVAYYIAKRNELRANAYEAEADELKRFHDELHQRGNVVQVTASSVAMPAGFTPERPYMLPHDISDFTGRGELLARLDAVATRDDGKPATGVIVLNGAPGVGKTALAVHWAHKNAGRFPDGVLYIDLNGFSGGPKIEPAAVVDQFLDELGFPAERIQKTAGRAPRLRNLLAGRRVLAVLDNAKDSTHVQPLLDCLSPCLVVITSRQRLSGPDRGGAEYLSVPPLTYEQGKEWLAYKVGERALREPDALAVLVSLCGAHVLALALRLVAVHVVARPQIRLEEFVEELRNERALLAVGEDGDRAEGSVRAAFEWSYRELDAETQRAFRLLGLHPGPDVSLEAAAAMLGVEQRHAKRVLDTLLNAHLVVQPDSRNRYRLHDLLKKYAAECVGKPRHKAERAAAMHRLLSFYLHTANNADRVVFPYQRGVGVMPLAHGVRPVEFVDDQAAMGWCTRERANLSMVIEYAGSHGFHDYSSKLPSAAGEILQRLGYHEDVTAALTIAVQSARVLGDVEVEADSLCNRGISRLRLHDFESAESDFMAAREIYDKIHHEHGRAAVVYCVAQLQVMRGEFQKGVESYLTVLPALRQLEERGPEVKALCRLAEAYQRLGDLEAAAMYCQEALWLAQRSGNTHGRGLSLSELGVICLARGEVLLAKRYLTDALAIHERVRDVAMAGRTCNALVAAYQYQNELAEAELYTRRAIACYHNVRAFREKAVAYDTLAQLLSAQGRRGEAVVAWTTAMNIFDDLGDARAASVRERLVGLASEPSNLPATQTEPIVKRSPGFHLPPLFGP